MVLITLLAACREDKEPTRAHSTETGVATDTWECGPRTEPPWPAGADPCDALDGARFRGANACDDVIWFHAGWIHHRSDHGYNNPYRCRPDGPVAKLRTCGVEPPYEFDVRTGVLLYEGLTFFLAEDTWSTHSGTPYAYYFYTGSATAWPSWCEGGSASAGHSGG